MFTALLSKPMILLGMVVLCLFFVWGISRNWNCKPVKPIRVTTTEYVVKSVVNGVTIEIESGLAGRRSATVILDKIYIPDNISIAETSRQSLEKLVGNTNTITVIRAKSGLFRDVNDPLYDTNDTTDDINININIDKNIAEARGPIVGIVYNSTNECLQIKQLEYGMAKIQAGVKDVPKEWYSAEKSAKKSKLGVWQKTK